MEPKNTNIRIIQTASLRTGSTLLYNALVGLFYPLDNAFYNNLNHQCFLKDTFVIKTHNLNIDSIIKTQKDYDLYFVTSSREGYKSIEAIHPRLLNFTYQELCETDTYTVEDIVINIANKCKTFLPKLLSEHINLKTSIERVNKMNQVVKSMKELPFYVVDSTYGVHGSHRNRNEKNQTIKDTDQILNVMKNLPFHIVDTTHMDRIEKEGINSTC